MKNIESNDETRISEALEAMRSEAGRRFSLDTVNLAELERRTEASHGQSCGG